MNNHIRHTLTALLLFFAASATNINAQTGNPDSIRFSLLTCSPGQEIYNLFGHTAIRCEYPEMGIDYVFNYGVFNFRAPNFVWRFVKGETDYMLAVEPYPDFVAGYKYNNRSIWQQRLNLTATEKAKLFQLLHTNALPENRVYRYSFFYDNCSTRPRDRIEECIEGEVVYDEIAPRKTFRNIVHECTEGYPWQRFGMDLCLGSDADELVSYRLEMFAPFYLMDAFKTAKIIDKEGNERALAAPPEIIVSAAPMQKNTVVFTPMRAALLLLILIGAITLYGIKKKKSFWAIDLLLFASAGIAGCVIAFLMFFSEHPSVDANYLLILLQPLHLLLLPFFIRKEIRREKSCYHTLNFIALTLFIVLWLIIPQHFNFAVLPLALSLLIRSGSNLVLTYKKK